MSKPMTNKEFSNKDQTFIKACANCKWRNPKKEGKIEPLPPSPCQASKWRNGKGMAYKTHNGLAKSSQL